MKLPAILEGDSRTRLMQGAVAGSLLTMVVGFGWGGWTLGSTAARNAETSATQATVAALAPICAEKFHNAADSQAKLVALKAADSWKRDDFVTKGGWATFPGSKEPADGVAQACANLLTAQK
jgi:hypothetical protein